MTDYSEADEINFGIRVDEKHLIILNQIPVETKWKTSILGYQLDGETVYRPNYDFMPTGYGLVILV